LARFINENENIAKKAGESMKKARFGVEGVLHTGFRRLSPNENQHVDKKEISRATR
jgi:hypothetical protein